MKLEFYDLNPEVQFNIALQKLNRYLPRAIETASRGRLSNTLSKRCAKWASRLGRAVFGLNPELREPKQ
jgi:muramidase (phage lysozyme)